MPDSGPGGGIAAAGGVLYVTTGFGEVFALDPRPAARSGSGRSRRRSAPRRRWRTGGSWWCSATTPPTRSTPAPATTLWQVQGIGGTGLLGGASPAADGQLVVLPFASGEVLGVLARNGLTVWGTAVTGGRRELARNRINDISGDPVIDGGVGLCLEPERADGPARRRDRRARLDDPGGLLRAGLAGRRLGLPVVGRRRAGARRRGDRRDRLGGRSCRSTSRTAGFFGRGKPFEAIAYYGPILAGGRLWVASADGLLRAFGPVDGALAGAGRAAGRRGGGAGDRRRGDVRRRRATGSFWLSNSR